MKADLGPVVMSVLPHTPAFTKHLIEALDAETMTGPISQRLIEVFKAGQPCVVIGAVGAVVRLLAPHITDKATDPPVVVIAPDGSVIVPVLGGHHGGNALATKIADIVGGTAAITTATDTQLGTALDAPPHGWCLSSQAAYKNIAARLIAGEAAFVDPKLDWLAEAAINQSEHVAIKLRSSVFTACAADELVYHPQTLVLGVGCERNTPASLLIEHVLKILGQNTIAPESIAAVVSIDLKTDEPAIHALAEHLGVPARFIPHDAVAAVEDRLSTPSLAVKAEVGVAGVAEGAALAAAGPNADILIPKQIGERCTAALASAPKICDPETMGQKRGSIMLVGLGPGRAEERTPLATECLRKAEHLVGFSGYFDYLPDLRSHQTCHTFALGEEHLRVRHALQLAANGYHVAVIGSGDAGVYAMGALVFEELHNSPDSKLQRIEVISAPGVTALQSASARCGAPLGHDFCAISLSDLLTPWTVIEQRITAAAHGDFVIAFYNPVSKRRRTGFMQAKEILLNHRPLDTPVVIGRNLGRADERLSLTTLKDVHVDDIDMLSTVLVGSSETRRIARASGLDWIYTPRGYAAKTVQDQPIETRA